MRVVTAQVGTNCCLEVIIIIIPSNPTTVLRSTSRIQQRQSLHLPLKETKECFRVPTTKFCVKLRREVSKQLPSTETVHPRSLDFLWKDLHPAKERKRPMAEENPTFAIQPKQGRLSVWRLRGHLSATTTTKTAQPATYPEECFVNLNNFRFQRHLGGWPFPQQQRTSLFPWWGRFATHHLTWWSTAREGCETSDTGNGYFCYV